MLKKRYKQILVLLLVPVLLFAGVVIWLDKLAPSSIHGALERGTLYLKDPESIRYRNVWFNGPYLCGEVNGRNGFGAYVGFQRFTLLRGFEADSIDIDSKSPGEPETGFEILWSSRCANKPSQGLINRIRTNAMAYRMWSALNIKAPDRNLIDDLSMRFAASLGEPEWSNQ